jgi:hypothetical protein
MPASTPRLDIAALDPSVIRARSTVDKTAAGVVVAIRDHEARAAGRALQRA